MSIQSSESSDVDPRWWLSIEGQVEGPHSTEHILGQLETNGVGRRAFACPVGGAEWKPITAWSAFATAERSTSVTPPPPPPTSADTPLTNAQLPAMANWICIYAIVISPTLWVTGGLSMLITGFEFHEDSKLLPIEVLARLVNGLISLVAVAFLMIGGLRLRSLNASGPTTMKVAIVTNFVFGFLTIVLLIILLAVAAETDTAETTPAEEVISFFMLTIGVASFAFEVAAVIWLTRYARTLPLTRS